MPRPDPSDARSEMVERDIVGRGVTDERVIAAMGAVPRERFVDPAQADVAHQDRPLPIGRGQTISQPYIVAEMAEAAEIGPDDVVLEIGTGSGYGAAVLARLGAQVWTVERISELAETARRRLRDEGIDNVHVVEGDGSLGWPAAAPYDAIVVTAAAPEVPAALVDQLSDGGRLVVPVGPNAVQELTRVRRVGDGTVRESLGAVRFVPLVGRQGYASDPRAPRPRRRSS